ncbi:hypothetical protein B0T26DRAFT_757700 [Lasiosphaeria miniovina]|uniref:Clr5 domain-containing protein n=1 Tax=Lasiosphaeria miniovina TaxID=1954250 RepID=A0AA39ZQG2_9PEZI|nr:uncharacterized protein B0T26DRAFT_757700 [Lasiosphaeria miniovina]KAK0701708.1 hypothetical protein B0T26DRAFT_757700 [Lasiosphaeria miniovina]
MDSHQLEDAVDTDSPENPVAEPSPLEPSAFTRQPTATDPLLGPRPATLDTCHNEIYRLYISENKTLAEVRETLKRDFDLDVKPKPLKTKLGKWGYSKDLKRGDALQIIQTKARREAQGKQSAVVLRGRAVDLDKQQTALPDESRALVATRDVVCITLPPSLPGSLPVIQQWRVPEKILVDVDTLIRGMFEAKSWRPNGHDLLIRSSWSQTSESITLEQFRANLNNGSDAARRSDFGVAFNYCKAAFIQGGVAARLKTHIAECCRTFAAPTKTNSSRPSILRGLSRIDALFGPWDRRMLDVASLRVEILILRGRLGEAETEARAFVDRADAVQNDEWQRFYSLIRARFFLSSAQYALRKRGEAIESLSDAQLYEAELSKLNDFGIFNGEKVRIKIYLEALKDENWARTEALSEC